MGGINNVKKKKTSNNERKSKDNLYHVVQSRPLVDTSRSRQFSVKKVTLILLTKT